MQAHWIERTLSKFQAGDKAQATTWLNLRNSPGHVGKPATDLVTMLPPGATVTIANGSAEVDGLIWWFIKTADAKFGYVAEVAPDGTVLLARSDKGNWERSIAFVLVWEGGYVWDKHDPGGETKYGISKNAHPDLDIKNLTIEQAKAIYFTSYWQASGADKLSWPLCLAHFDFAVNAGVGQANKTLSACEFNFERYIELRRQFYRSLSQFNRYGMAWMRRVDDVVKAAL